MYYDGSSPTITNCSFISNTTTAPGAGIYTTNVSNTVITSCVFDSNTTTATGGAVQNDGGSTAAITNCTLYANSANAGGGLFNGSSSTATVTNCIFWGNVATGGSGGQILNSGGTATVSYSDIDGGCTTVPGSTISVTCGDGNINADPLFTATGDFHLTSTSPCIDVGYDADAPTTDMDGNPRVDISTVDNCDTAGDPDCSWYSDMGAYELQ